MIPPHDARLFRALLLLLVATLSNGCADPPPDLKSVVLSYEQEDTWCGNCPHYRVEFLSDMVRFHGISGCAVPGLQVVRTSPTVFAELTRAFAEADFFNIPRIDPSGKVIHDVRVITVTYRDDRRVHETIDAARQLPQLNRLEEQLRDAAKIVEDLVLIPSVASYERLLKGGWYVDTIGSDGENALTAAVSRNREAALFLLAHGATVSRRALESSVYSDNVEFFRALMKARQLDLESDEAVELFIHAAGRSTNITRFLLEQGVNPNVRDARGETPLDAAVSSSSFERVRLLLSRGADARRSAGVMMNAVRQDRSGLITLLAQHGADVNARERWSGRTPLMAASDTCKYWHITPLLEAGADPFIKNKDGRTALQPETAIAGRTESCDKSLALLQDAVRIRLKPPVSIQP